MNVGELIDHLSRFDRSLPVVYPNLDCTDLLIVDEVADVTLRSRPAHPWPNSGERHDYPGHVRDSDLNPEEYGPEWPAIRIQ